MRALVIWENSMNGLFSKEFLASLGISLDDSTYALFDNHVEQTLNERVIESIVDELTDEQVVELGQLDTSDHTTLQHWLVANVTELNVIIEDEVAILLGEIAENSQSI